MKYDKGQFINKENDCLFFCSYKQSCLSTWYPTPINFNGIHFFCAEQLISYRRAVLFNDEEMMKLIPTASTLSEVKKMHGRITGFNRRIWDENRDKIAYEANLLKFQQSDKLKEYLLSTADKLLVYTHPIDTVMGCGMRAEWQDVGDVSKWSGENKLGFILMEIRDYLSTDVEN